MSEIPHDDAPVQHPSGLPLAHWLTLTEGLIAARVAESLEEHGLTRVQWQLLNTLTVAPQSRAELEAGFEEEQRTTHRRPGRSRSREGRRRRHAHPSLLRPFAISVELAVKFCFL